MGDKSAGADQGFWLMRQELEICRQMIDDGSYDSGNVSASNEFGVNGRHIV